MTTLKRSHIWLIATLLTFSEQAYADWDIIHDFGQKMRVVFFVDENLGLAGNNRGPIQIFRTEDGGQTWTESSIPYIDNAKVSSITMRNDTGYAAIYGTTATLLKSIDGGRSWFDFSPRDRNMQSIAFEGVDVVPASNALILSTWEGGAWTQDFPSIVWNLELAGSAVDGRSNGVASNGMDVVVTGFGEREWYSHDGGRTWNRANDIPESWGVYSLADTRSFYALPEGDEEAPQRTVWRSMDGGEFWDDIYTFPNGGARFTGHIDGKGRRLYVQSDEDAARGMYRSDDLGLTWKRVGGPSNDRDTRFSVVGCGEIVYTLDDEGRLYKTTDGGDGTFFGGAGQTLAFEQDTIYIEGHSCKQIRLPIEIQASGCTVSRLDSVTLTGSANIALENTDSRLVLTIDSFIFRHSDPTQSIDTSVITMYANDEERKLVIISRNTLELSFYLGQPESKLAGQDVEIPVYVSNIRPGVSVKGVEITVNADADLLSNWRLLGSPLPLDGDNARVSLVFDPPLTNGYDHTQPVAILTASNYLTGITSTPVLIDSISISTSAPVTSCNSSSVAYVQSPACGDSTLREVILQEAEGIISIGPNPVRTFLQVETRSVEDAQVFVFDMLGRLADAQVTARPGGFTVDCTDLNSGSYVVVMVLRGRVIGRRNFIKID